MRAAAALLLAGLVACGVVQDPVPIAGETGELAGEWEGQYWGTQSGRTGSIFFRLDPGADTARGDVVMYPIGTNVVNAPWDPAAPPEATRPRAEVLPITFVWARGGEVWGRLNPYRDPDCGCLLTTTFRGTLVGDTLRGTFSSWHEEMARRTEGEWRVVRR